MPTSKRFISFFLFLALALAGCAATKTSDVFTDEKITGPKVVAVQGARAPWAYEIEKRLKARGFQIKRMASQNVAVERASPSKTTIYNEASARYVLVLDGFAPNDAMNRCYGGGYNFAYIDAELIDVAQNETIAHYSNSGMSEGCPPLSGTIFTDIGNMVSSAWE